VTISGESLRPQDLIQKPESDVRIKVGRRVQEEE
jgi:hypothetical protein